MHRRVRCPHCHYWTDALLVWAAGDSCPACNAPMRVSDRAYEERLPPPPKARPWRSHERPRRSPGGIGPTAMLSQRR